MPAIAVLLIDDDALDRKAVARAMAQLGPGYALHEAGDSCLGVERAVSETFDCILVDYNMPGMNGVELASRLTLRQPNLPVLLISGERLEDLPTAIVGSRGWRFLPKPIGYARLTSAVYELLPTSSPRISEIQRANPPPPT